ncbi:MAG TPA: hypothetical protein VK869_12700 [Rubrobacteraceae bacterium]|jgi:hypothetical protein|nr:hypothetical protein [Rubrobacteraceae bacterium]
MLGVIRSTRVSGKGCEELGRMNLLDTSRCCKICHSADEHSSAAPLGPCHVTLPDGGDVFVCCAGKKQLLLGSR